MFTRHRTPLLAMLAVAAVSMAACTPDADPEPDAPAEPDEAPEPEAPVEPDAEDESALESEADDEPVTLTLLTHDSFEISEEVLAEFTEATGVEVSVTGLGDAGSALNQAILTRDDPQGDLFFGVDNTFLTRALDAELFVPYSSPLLEHVPERFQLDPEHRATPIDYGDVCLNYDAAWFEGSDLAVPNDLEDLTDGAYDGLLVVTNPATSSPGLAFLLATIERFGEDEHLDFWAGLDDNDVVVTDGWSQAYYEEFSGTGGGDRPLVLSYASSPPAEVFFADPQPDEPPTGVIEESCFRQIEFVGILQGTEHEQEAQRLVDFMLDVTFQEDVPLNMFVFPVNEQAQLPEVFEQHAVVPDEPFEMDPERIGANREQWIEAWTSTVLR